MTSAVLNTCVHLVCQLRTIFSNPLEQKAFQHMVFQASEKSMVWQAGAHILNVLSTTKLMSDLDRAAAYDAWNKDPASFSINLFLGARLRRIDPSDFPMPSIFAKSPKLTELYGKIIIPCTHPNPRDRPTMEELYNVCFQT